MPMNSNNNLCVHCAKIGVASTITTLYINFEETINLCNNNMCLHPLGSPVTDNNSPSTKFSVPQSLDFSDIDCLLDAPADDNNITKLVSALNANACGNEFDKPPNELTPRRNNPSNSIASVDYCAKRPVNSQVQTAGFKTKNVVSILKFPNKIVGVTSCISRGPTTPKPIIAKESISLTKAPDPVNQRKRQFPCFQISSTAEDSSAQKRKPPAPPKTNTKTSTPVRSRRKESKPHNIFTFSEGVTSKSRNKKRSTKPGNSSVDSSSQSAVSGGVNNSLVRQWLAKQSPGRAYPGYGVKSTSLRGTSDGRSVTDSVPPSPASLD